MSVSDKKEVFDELNDEFLKRRDQSAPTAEVIEENDLTADKEDKSKGFAAKKMARELKAFSENYLNDISMDVRISPHVALKPGTLIVTWRDIRGINQNDDAVEISMNGVKFICRDGDPIAITKLTFPESGKTMEVAHSDLHTNEDGYAIFRLIDFDNNAEDWMLWIETFSRINEES